MKKLTQLAAAIALSTAGVVAQADVSANIGYASEYYFRGIMQAESSASAGIDYEESGFYAGAWTADVGDGLEVDGYFGYGMETESGITAGVGFTTYQYTGDTFDSEYNELNLNLGYGVFSLEYSVGTHGSDAGLGIDKSDYSFLALTAESNGFYGKLASYGKDADGEYLELGYGTTISDIDFGVAVIFNSKELSFEVDSDGNAAADEAIVFTIGKSFDL